MELWKRSFEPQSEARVVQPEPTSAAEPPVQMQSTQVVSVNRGVHQYRWLADAV